jgi:hypothetical protein
MGYEPHPWLAYSVLELAFMGTSVIKSYAVCMYVFIFNFN